MFVEGIIWVLIISSLDDCSVCISWPCLSDLHLSAFSNMIALLPCLEFFISRLSTGKKNLLNSVLYLIELYETHFAIHFVLSCSNVKLSALPSNTFSHPSLHVSLYLLHSGKTLLLQTLFPPVLCCCYYFFNKPNAY